MKLHSGAPFWLVSDGLVEMGTSAPLPQTSDVVVIGAGITGALVADALAAEGIGVVVLDRRAPACGSTVASTSLVSYEIDRGLGELVEMIGEQDAIRAYELCGAAVDDIGAIARTLPDTAFAVCPSVCLASHRRHAGALREEAELRQQHGIDAAYWTPEQLAERYGFPSHGALHTGKAAVLDPLRFTRSLLHRAMQRGAVLLSRTAVRDVRQDGPGLIVTTERGTIRARWVIYAMGYEMPPALRTGLVALHTTYALVTEPLADLGPWDGSCIVWETARPYFYMRATADRRVMIGGADTPFENEAWRDRLMPGRTKRLERQLGRWLPGVATETAFVWAGTFGETRDGLPYIGPMPDCSQAVYALGYGANGITFGAIAAKIIADICLGRPNDDTRLFRLDR